MDLQRATLVDELMASNVTQTVLNMLQVICLAHGEGRWGFLVADSDAYNSVVPPPGRGHDLHRRQQYGSREDLSSLAAPGKRGQSVSASQRPPLDGKARGHRGQPDDAHSR